MSQNEDLTNDRSQVYSRPAAHFDGDDAPWWCGHPPHPAAAAPCGMPPLNISPPTLPATSP